MPGSGNRWRDLEQELHGEREPAARPARRSRKPPSRRTAPPVVDAGNGAERASQEQADARHSPQR
jgi:hypothetical protein